MDLKVDTDKLLALVRVNSQAAEGLAETVVGFAEAARTLQTRWLGDAQSAFAQRASFADAQGRMRAGDLQHAARRLAQLAEDYRQADVAGARAVIGI